MLLLLAARPGETDYHAQVRASFEELREKLADVEGGEHVIEALGPAAEAAAAAEQAAAEEDQMIDPAATVAAWATLLSA